MEELPTILLVGTPGVGKRTLLQRLRECEAARATDGARPPEGACVLRLDTKYYTADAEVRVITLEAGEDEHADAEQQEQQQQQHLQQEEYEQQQRADCAAEAVVLVIDAADAASFRAARRWAAANDTSAAGVCLLVTNKADAARGAGNTLGAATTGSSALAPDAAAWCLDHGFEYVEAAAGAPGIDADLSLDGDRQGVARVAEALEAHLWPGLTRKPAPAAGTAAAAAHAAAARGAAGGAGDDTRDQGERPEQGHAAGAAAAALGAAGASGGEAAGCAAADDAQAKGRGCGRDNSGSSGSGGEDDDLEADVESFEQIMQQLAGARERLAKLPDGDRRAQAAALALRFAAMLGGSDGDDDDDDAGDLAPVS